VFKLILAGGPAGLVVFESLGFENMRLYTRMIGDASPRQVRWAAGALLPYRSRSDPPGVRVRLASRPRAARHPVRRAASRRLCAT
jgi:hypothetical protein